MGIRYDERAGAWAVHNANGNQCGEASTKQLAALYEAAPELLEAVKEAANVIEHYTPFGGIAARLQDLVERVGGEA